MTSILEKDPLTRAGPTRRPLLEIRDVVIRSRRNGGAPIVAGVSMTVGEGEVLGIVGESGSGKSLTCLAVAGLLPQGVGLASGSIRLQGRDLTGLDEKALSKVRGREIGFVFQDPVAALNPGISVGTQVVEPIRRHLGLSGSESKARAIEWLDRVGIPGAARRYRAYPREFSGGMRQRVMIAMALCCNPKLLIADEPTTALDVTMQAQILDLIRQLQQEISLTVMLVTHDFGVAKSIADRAVVFYAGQIVEEGTSDQVCRNPQHPYTAGLLRSVPSLAAGRGIPVGMPGAPPSLGGQLAGCRFYSRCEVHSDDCRTGEIRLNEVPGDRLTRCTYPERIHLNVRGAEATVAAVPVGLGSGPRSQPVLAVDDVNVVYGRSGMGRSRSVHALLGASLSVAPGEVVAIIGESGSGKSTLVRAVVGLVPTTGGRITVEGKDMVGCSAGERRQRLRGVQMVFQNPYASLSPHLKVKDIVAESLDIWEPHVDASTRTEQVRQVLAKVGIDPDRIEEKTATFSGGQRQRIALARALIAEPRLLICDEVLSALDVSTQAQLLGVLNDLKRQGQFAMLIISHNLAVLRYIADRVVVMYAGVIVETGSVEQIVDAPQHPYTRALVAAGQAVDVGAPAAGFTDRTGEAPDPTNLPPGCVYQQSCPEKTDICTASRPEPVLVAAGASVRCFHRQPVALPVRSAEPGDVKAAMKGVTRHEPPHP